MENKKEIVFELINQHTIGDLRTENDLYNAKFHAIITLNFLEYLKNNDKFNVEYIEILKNEIPKFNIKNKETKKILKLKFYGIDNFNRPIFKDIENKKFYGSTDKLFNHNANVTEVLSIVDKKDLTYFGKSFNCEPLGISINPEIEIEFILN